MPRLATLVGARLLQALAVALLVGFVCFFLVRTLPGDMAFRIAHPAMGLT